MNYHDTAYFNGPTRIHNNAAWERQMHARPEMEESKKIFRAEQDEAWGNRRIGSHTPPDYLEKEEIAWKKHLDRMALLARGKQAKWSLCRNCGSEKISAGRRFCAGCKKKLKIQRRRKSGSDVVKSALASAS